MQAVFLSGSSQRSQMGVDEIRPDFRWFRYHLLEIMLPPGGGSGLPAAASRGASRSPSAKYFALAETNTAWLSALVPLIASRL